MTDILNWFPRIVLKDNTVYFPEKHMSLYYNCSGNLMPEGWYIQGRKPNNDYSTVISLKDTRQDRPTGMFDKNKKMSYENDIVKAKLNLTTIEGKIIMRNGYWIVQTKENEIWNLYAFKNIKVIGMVEYGGSGI